MKEADRLIEQGREEIRSNHSDGAQVLAEHALRILKHSLEASLITNDEVSYKDVRTKCEVLAKARPSMSAAIQSIFARLLRNLEQVTEPGADITAVALDMIKDLNVAHSGYKDSALALWAEAGLSICIITISYSSSVMRLLEEILKCRLPDDRFGEITVMVCESRPLFEGVQFAKDLRTIDTQHSLRVEIISDAYGPDAVRNYATIVLIGADRVDRNTGNVWNKIGSLGIALAAAAYRNGSRRIKCFAVCSIDKVSECDESEIYEENDSAEVRNVWENQDGLEEIQVRNVYFERIEAHLVDCLITPEHGFSHIP